MVPELAPRLDGWKAIADYLRRDVRTAQRWRDERGMPVHRVPGGKSGGVFAQPGEIADWLLQARSGRDVDATHTPHDAAAPREEPADVSRDATGVLAAEFGVYPIAGELPSAEKGRRHFAAIASIAAGLLTVSMAAALITRRAPDPVRIEANGSTVIARAADDAVLWTYHLPERPGAQVDGSILGRVEVNATARADFHRPDADVVALASITKVGNAPNEDMFFRNSVYCLSSQGVLRWTFFPRTRLTFGRRDFGDAWRAGAWVMLPGGTPRLMVSFFDHVWWPSFVASVRPDGTADTVFVNSGHIKALARVQSPSRDFVLAGGVNNEYRAAALAVLDRSDPPSTSPQTAHGPFACETCPSGRPRAYFVFARPEVSVATGVPYEYADSINVPPNATGFDVSVTNRSTLFFRAVYRFSNDMTPVSVAMSDAYWEFHRDLWRSGKLNHAPEDCPERTRGVTIRMWTAARGWTDVNVPPTFAAPDPQ